MKKTEFKKIIKECIKEAIIEDGVLSSVISEVIRGLNTKQIVENDQTKVAQKQEEEVKLEVEKVQKVRVEKLHETKQKMLEAIGQDSYNGVNIFEGTIPITRSGNPDAASSPNSPLAGVEAGDPGVDISSLVSNGAVKKIWQQINK